MKIQKILLVEDDENIRILAQMSLEASTDWRILIAPSGAEALGIAAQEKPDLILLDVMMPGMDGFTTLAGLRENPASAGIPVIFMTAKIQSQELEDYSKLGIAGVISKPFDPLKLAAEITHLVSTSTAVG